MSVLASDQHGVNASTTIAIRNVSDQGAAVGVAENKALVRRFYDEVWSVGGEGGGRWFGGIDRQLRASMLSPFVSQKLGTFVAKANAEKLVVLKQLIEAGKVTPVIEKTYALSEVPEAIRNLEEGHARGKVAITV
jgi:NADPH:quinone reductase-like Zn-dependent oxidoreductase